jgi:hypothetical protein
VLLIKRGYRGASARALSLPSAALFFCGCARFCDLRVCGPPDRPGHPRRRRAARE